MRILVTGGTGHLGRDIVSLLKDQGHQVRVLARTAGPDPAVERIARGVRPVLRRPGPVARQGA